PGLFRQHDHLVLAHFHHAAFQAEGFHLALRQGPHLPEPYGGITGTVAKKRSLPEIREEIKKWGSCAHLHFFSSSP
ncbi:MAG TPA: hypothetical protein PLL18_06190, partial [Flavobacteriales bacterium]|nr:hypothetical protein [Flavobacteriales bacterium]